MEKSNEVSNPVTKVPETTQPQTGIPQQPVDGTPEQPLTEPILPQKASKKWLLPGLIGLVVITLGVAGYFAYRNFQMVRQKARQLQSTIFPTGPTPTATVPTSEPTPEPSAIHPNSFTYKNFTIGYPDDWVILDMSINEDFPIKERLSPVYAEGKVIALNKNSVYLIITIETESEAGAGGIFIDDQQYNEFISDRDKVLVGNSTFYLRKNHHASSSLLESHGGPYAWSCLAEYLPNKTTQSGKVFKGYEDVIKKNGFAYNFIVVSENGGQTPPEIQSEITTILQSIDW